MPTTREDRGGSPPIVVTISDRSGGRVEARFHTQAEADRFAAKHAPGSGTGALPANRATLNRIAGRSAPKNPPRTVRGVLTRLAGVMQTRDR